MLTKIFRKNIFSCHARLLTKKLAPIFFKQPSACRNSKMADFSQKYSNFYPPSFPLCLPDLRYLPPIVTTTFRPLFCSRYHIPPPGSAIRPSGAAARFRSTERRLVHVTVFVFPPLYSAARFESTERTSLLGLGF